MVSFLRNKLAWLALLIVVIGWLVWWANQPLVYRLLVINQGEYTLDKVSVQGSALVSANDLMNVPPNTHGLIEATISGEGQLRFEVLQGVNRVDMLLVKQGIPSVWSQTLTIEGTGRYMVSDGLATP